MKILVATKEAQGRRRNDFCHAQEGEPVRFAFECDGESVDGKCGCRRAMVGIVTGKATTTFKVAEAGMTREQFEAMLLRDDIAIGLVSDPVTEREEKGARDAAAELVRIASLAPEGTVLEKRGARIKVRVEVKIH